MTQRFYLGRLISSSVLFGIYFHLPGTSILDTMYGFLFSECFGLELQPLDLGPGALGFWEQEYGVL